jgi:hypothetical protein
MQRVTLEDFRQLQQQLLMARQALYDSEELCKEQELELRKHRTLSAWFPPPNDARQPSNPFGDASPSMAIEASPSYASTPPACRDGTHSLNTALGPLGVRSPCFAFPWLH